MCFAFFQYGWTYFLCNISQISNLVEHKYVEHVISSLNCARAAQSTAYCVLHIYLTHVAAILFFVSGQNAKRRYVCQQNKTQTDHNCIQIETERALVKWSDVATNCILLFCLSEGCRRQSGRSAELCNPHRTVNTHMHWAEGKSRPLLAQVLSL
jgi:hypothetical protein